MTSKPKQAEAQPAEPNEQVLTELELKRLARLLNVLMEVDFYIKRNNQEMTND